MSRGILESFDDVRRGHDITDYLVGLSVLELGQRDPVSKSWGILKKECIGGCIYLYNKIQSIGRSIGECRRRRTTCTGVIERKFDNEYEGARGVPGCILGQLSRQWASWWSAEEGRAWPVAIEGPMRTSAQIAT
ncbi:hypothetical protein WAI453_001823 [Rhynchosporium graminicola]